MHSSLGEPAILLSIVLHAWRVSHYRAPPWHQIDVAGWLYTFPCCEVLSFVFVDMSSLAALQVITFIFVHCVTVAEALIAVVAVDMWRISVLGVLIPVFYLNAWPCILLTCWHVRA